MNRGNLWQGLGCNKQSQAPCLTKLILMTATALYIYNTKRSCCGGACQGHSLQRRRSALGAQTKHSTVVRH